MTTVLVRRKPRRTPPPMPAGEIRLEPPPALPSRRADPLTWTLLFLPVILAGAAAVLVVLTAAPAPALYVVLGLSVLAQLGVLLGGLIRTGRRSALAAARRDYLRYLGRMRRQVRRAAEEQRRAVEWSNPRPGLLWAIPRSGRLWERRPSDPDFAEVRAGTGRQDLAIRLLAPETGPVEDLEPLTTGALRRFGRTHATVPDLPVRVRLGSYAHIAVAGEPQAAYALVRSMIMQFATFHAPGDVRISVCASAGRAGRWDWVKWLPHAAHPSVRDALGPARLVAPSLTALEDLLGGDLKDRPVESWAGELPFHLVILDGGHASADSALAAGTIAGACVVDLSGSIPPRPGTLRLGVTADRLTSDAGRDLCPDQVAEGQAEALARQLAPLRLDTAAETPGRGLADFLGLGQVPDMWAEDHHMTAPIGVDPAGDPVDLDHRTRAEGGTGPHTLLVGDRRGEMIQTMVLGLALTHSPDRLTVALLAAGSGSFDGLAALPHVSALVTGLAAAPAELERLLLTLRGELARREVVLRRSGHRTLGKYEEDPDRPPLPRLLLVVDGFADLKAAEPEVGTVLDAIGRDGWSLGVHLLLTAARLTPDALSSGLGMHFTNRIALRTFSAGDSVAVLGTPDAHALPRHGHAYLRTGPKAPPLRFRPAALTTPRPVPADAGASKAGEVRVFSAAVMPLDGERAAAEGPDLVRDMQAAHGPVRRLLPRPLTAGRTLDELAVKRGGMRAAIGRVDRPAEQRREPYVLDLTRRPGNTGVVGRQGAGKTALLRTIVAALALERSPGELAIHLVGTPDFVGSLAGLPHVVGTTSYDRLDPARMVDTFTEGLWAIRNEGHHLLVIDDWPAPRGGKVLAKALAEWADGRERARLVVSARSWIDLPPALRAILDLPLELRLDQPKESRIDGRLAGHVPLDQPGRGLTADGLHFLAALPRIDGVREAETMAEGLVALVHDVRERYPREPAR
jgi:S-DNA-T family DNA segregation ATPase FtsK/SpoIIIE